MIILHHNRCNKPELVRGDMPTAKTPVRIDLAGGGLMLHHFVNKLVEML